jgi:hypothetical protein
MRYSEIEDALQLELAKRGLKLIWKPTPDKLSEGNLVVFGAEEQAEKTTPNPFFEDQAAGFQDGLLAALEAVGIPRASLHSSYPRICRGKCWCTYIARLTQETFKELKCHGHN